MPIDFNSLIQQRLPNLVKRGSLPIEQQSFSRGDKFQQLMKMLQPPEAEAPAPSSQLVAARTAGLEGARPDEESGFNIFNSLISLLDIVGRPVRGLLGAGISAAKGDLDKAGSRLLDAALTPFDALTFNIFDVAKEETNTTGSDLLNDLGWKSGTTAEDERRIRIAMAAGVSRRDAIRQFGIYGDRRLPESVAQSFEKVLQAAKAADPELDLNPTMDDLKNAVDAQDFAGFAAEVLLDPLTYLSMGVTSAGKAAKAVGAIAEQAPRLAKAVRAAVSLDDALKAIKVSKEIGGKQQARLTKLITRAWKHAPEGEKPSLYLADNWAKQVREGQRAMFTTIGGKPLVKGGPVAEVLTHIGQTKVAEEVLGKATVSGRLGQAMQLPGVEQVVGGVKGLVRFARDKLDTKTGVNFIDELLVSRDAEARKGLTEIGRVLNSFDSELRQVAKGDAVVEKSLRQQVSKAVELSKQTGGDFAEATDAARVALGLSNNAVGADTVAKIAAGIVRINNTMLDNASKVPTRIRELNDDTIQYLHHMLTPEAKKLFAEQKKTTKWLESTGLEFNARSRTFNARSEKSYGKTLDELNNAFRGEHGIDLFNPDPIAATRESVRLTQRAVANAKFAEAFVREYGATTDDTLKALLESVDGLPERLLNMRKAAEYDAATTKAAARAAREMGAAHGGTFKPKPGIQGLLEYVTKERTPKAAAFAAKMNPNNRQQVKELRKLIKEEILAQRPKVSVALAKTKPTGLPDLNKIPEGLDVYGTAEYFKKVLKDSGKVEPGTVSAFDIYNRLGLKLPNTPEDLAKLVSVRMPEEAAAFVTRALKIQKDPGTFIRYYDKITNWMKSWVTVPFLQFHGRNFLENSFKNILEGNTNPANYKNAAKLLSQASDLNAGSPDWVGKAANKLKQVFRSMGEPDVATLKDLKEAGVGDNYAKIADWLVAHGVLDNRVTSEFGEVLQDGVEGTGRAARQVRGLGAKVVKELGTQGGVLRAGYALGAGTENLHRTSLFLDRIRKGYSAIEAAAEVKRVFFDYRALTNFESTYAKRMGFFYSFYRNNLRYILQQAFTKPEMTKQILRLFQNDPDNPKQKWLSDKASFTAGAKEVALGFIPQQQFSMFGFNGEDIVDKLQNKAQQLVGMGNPLITTPLEVAFNKDLFTGGQLLQETTSVDWSFAPEAVQELIGYHQNEKGEHKIGRVWNLVFGAVPAIGRFSSTALQLTRKERTYWEKLTQLVSGIKIQDRDLEKEDLALIDRNLLRAKQQLPLVKRDNYGNYRVNEETRMGRVASAMLFPSKAKMKDLALEPVILFKLKPYMTFDKDGEVIVTDPLRLKMHEVAVEYFPREQAFFDATETRKAVVRSIQGREVNPLDEEAQKGFSAFLQGTQ
jgi:hypothetical protein